MSLRIDSQPRKGTVNSSLKPRLTAKLGSNVNPACIYSANASLVDSSGATTAEGVLGGQFNISGECNRHGTEITFKWDKLSMNKKGTYRFHITVLEASPDHSMYAQLGSILTDTIKISSS